MSSADFLDHHLICYRIRRKTLDLCSIGDEIILLCKTFELRRREFKFLLIKTHEENSKKDLVLSSVPLDPLKNNLLGAPIMSKIRKLSNMNGLEIDTIGKYFKQGSIEAKVNMEYQRFIQLSKLFKLFKAQIENEPLTTRLDSQIRSMIGECLESISTKQSHSFKRILSDFLRHLENRIVLIDKLFSLQKRDISTDYTQQISRSKRGATLSNAWEGAASNTAQKIDLKKFKSKMENFLQMGKNNRDDGSSDDDYEAERQASPTRLVVSSNLSDMTIHDGDNMFIIARSITLKNLDERRRAKNFDIPSQRSNSPNSPSRVRRKSGSGTFSISSIDKQTQERKAIDERERKKKEGQEILKKIFAFKLTQLEKSKAHKGWSNNTAKYQGPTIRIGLDAKSEEDRGEIDERMQIPLSLPGVDKSANIISHLQKGSKDFNRKKTVDFESDRSGDLHLNSDEFERLTCSDPGIYFASEPSLLAKACLVSLSDFEFLETLGSGAYGKVYLVRKRATGDVFAIKIIGTDNEVSKSYIDNLLNEREVFSVISSDFCVNAFATFVYKSLVCFVMEYLPGKDLLDAIFISEEFSLDSFSIQFYLAEIVLGIEALHDGGIIHRDIKPANILLDEGGHIKITDFGLSEFRNKIGGYQQVQEEDVLIKGSAQYLAPEVVKGDEVSFEIDWWAMGVMAYLFINDEFPFDGETQSEVHEAILAGNIKWPNIGMLLHFTIRHW